MTKKKKKLFGRLRNFSFETKIKKGGMFFFSFFLSFFFKFFSSLSLQPNQEDVFKVNSNRKTRELRRRNNKREIIVGWCFNVISIGREGGRVKEEQ